MRLLLKHRGSTMIRLLYQQTILVRSPRWCLQVGGWTYAEQAAAVQQVLESQALGIARACEEALQQVRPCHGAYKALGLWCSKDAALCIVRHPMEHAGGSQ
jgi:hypothetical protein